MAAPRTEKEMPFLDHLEELRRRLMWILGALTVGVVAAFAILYNIDVIHILTGPIEPYLEGGQLVYTHPADAFRVVMLSSFILGIIFALPVIAWHVWAFLSPALYSHEKKVIIPVLIGATLLFAGGAALAFLVIIPVTLRFLLSFQSATLTPMITASGYFGFAFSLSLAFGAVFELPIVIAALTALGLVTPTMLARFRRHAAVMCIVTSAFITPGGDPMSLLIMTVPLYLLYEVSIGLSSIIHRRRARRQSIALAGQEAGA